jgi:hypothetical protein
LKNIGCPCDYKVVFSESIGPGRSGATSRLSAADSHSGDILQQVGVCTLFKHLMANASLFDLLFHRLVLRRVHFIYSNFAWGLHGGVDVKWSGWRLICFGAALT